ncbi:MAG: nucleotide exchange factor GrpE, partial [Candidatus Marsarchaeota archaeon]|nr:nucleotide exchange factor GrpE [Candidatus Marsarchaeota archaeon]
MSEDKRNMKDKKNEKKAADENIVKEAEKEQEGKPNVQEKNDDAEGCADIKEKLLRLAAEFENYKRRSRNEIDSSRNSGKAELLKGLLPVIDEFELALIS